jgi:hypothetical protein
MQRRMALLLSLLWWCPRYQPNANQTTVRKCVTKHASLLRRLSGLLDKFGLDGLRSGDLFGMMQTFKIVIYLRLAFLREVSLCVAFREFLPVGEAT